MPSLSRSRDHPRVCGEHTMRKSSHSLRRGSSPRMRGAPDPGKLTARRRRIIPAYAGSTNTLLYCSTTVRGSSPRMRGARRYYADWSSAPGIIPAYAGSTSARCSSPDSSQDHPRVCGEHVNSSLEVSADSGSSPRMRGAHGADLKVCYACRIIPAYAGSTVAWSLKRDTSKDHPRVCGEHNVPQAVASSL